ncbi:MAG: hypothetical protein V4662_02945 [Verrucomicrobiota bacterium]
MKPQDWFGLFLRCLGVVTVLVGIYSTISVITILLISGGMGRGISGMSALNIAGAFVVGHLLIRRADAIVRYAYPPKDPPQ